MRVTQTEIERQITQSIGVKLAGILKENTRHRICGLLTAAGRSAEWEDALEHISEHFGPVAGKPTHAIFRRKFRNPDTLKSYIRQAASRPSTMRLSRLRDGFAQPIGSPCLLIVRVFAEPLGEIDDQRVLVVIADFQGNLVTAYPTSLLSLKSI